MSGFKEVSFADRQKAAQQAKQNILNKFRAQPGADDPAVKQRQAEREAQAEARASQFRKLVSQQLEIKHDDERVDESA